MRAPVCNPLPCPTATETQHVTAPSLARLEPVTAPLLLSVRGTPALEQREERRERLLLGQITAGAQHDHSEAQLVCNRALVEISRAGRAELRPSNTIVRCGSHQLTQQRCARSETSPCIAGTFCIDRGQSRSRSQGLRRCSHKTCNKSRQLHSEPFLPYLTCSHTTSVFKTRTSKERSRAQAWLAAKSSRLPARRTGLPSRATRRTAGSR